MTETTKLPAEFSADLKSLEAFGAFVDRSPDFLKAEAVAARVETIRSNDCVEPLTNTRIPRAKLEIEGTNYRETLRFGNLVSRQRGVLSILESFMGRLGKPLSDLKIYSPESVTAFADRMRAMAPGFTGSEYAASPAARRRLSGVRFEDLTQLTFPSSYFDAVLTNEVLEYVPSIDAALSEMMRILRPGGVMISTHTFAAAQATPIVRAELVNGAVVHRMEPDYRWDPLDPAGSLVFETPGWDIVERCRKAGASDAFVRLHGSIRHGVIGAGECGIYATVAVR